MNFSSSKLERWDFQSLVLPNGHNISDILVPFISKVSKRLMGGDDGTYSVLDGKVTFILEELGLFALILTRRLLRKPH